MPRLSRLLKPIEIAFRRFLIRLLKFFVHRSSAIPKTFDFNRAKFLFVRQDRIGDVLISTPLFHLVKNRYPDAAVDVLLSKNNHFALDNDPMIGKIWIYEKNIKKLINFIKQIRKEKYDFVVDLMDNQSATSTFLCLLAGGKYNIGLKKENDFVYDVVCPLLSRKEVHILQRILELLRPFGITSSWTDLKLHYFLRPENDKWAEQFFIEKKLKDKLTIGINISAGSEARDWGNRNYRGLIEFIFNKNSDTNVVVLYSPNEKHRAEKIAHGLDRCFISPLTKSFDQFAALISKVNLLITPDTSAVHIAAAFGIPEIVLYIQFNKELRIWDPVGVPHISLIADVNDLKAITLAKVITAYDELYKTIKN